MFVIPHFTLVTTFTGKPQINAVTHGKLDNQNRKQKSEKCCRNTACLILRIDRRRENGNVKYINL